MKVRQGFVSNSSSSSFIAVGVKSSLVPKEKIEDYENDFDYFEADETPNGQDMCGKLIDSFEYESGEVTIQELQEVSHAIAKVLGVSESKMVVFYGHRYC